MATPQGSTDKMPYLLCCDQMKRALECGFLYETDAVLRSKGQVIEHTTVLAFDSERAKEAALPPFDFCPWCGESIEDLRVGTR